MSVNTKVFTSFAFDAATIHTQVRWDVSGYITATASWFSTITALSTGVIAFEYSVDGLYWKQLVDIDGTNVTFSADGGTKLIDLSGINWVRARVSTAQSGVVGVPSLHCKTAPDLRVTVP